MDRSTNFTGIFVALILMLCIQASHAGSATWDHNPGSSDWNTATNWTPTTVPNGPADTATFALSNTTNVSISTNIGVNGIFFAPGASAYTITANPGHTLTLSGTGITNSSGATQIFVAASDIFGNGGIIVFSKSATARDNFFTTNNASGSSEGGAIVFKDTSTAGGATIDNSGTTSFFNRSSAGSASIQNEQFGGISFSGSSTAGSAVISNESFAGMSFGDSSTAGSASISSNDATLIVFSGSSSAGSAGIGTLGDIFFAARSSAGSANISSAGSIFGGLINFSGSSTAGTARIDLGVRQIPDFETGAVLEFGDRSTAGGATIQSSGSKIDFFGFSKGGTAQIDLEASPPDPFNPIFPGVLEISGHNAPGVTIGSIQGDASSLVFLGANNLTVGSNNLSTTFSGVMQDGGGNGGTGGSLTKIGTGTLDLTGVNTYTGKTNINRGVLQVDGSITSNTFVNHFGMLAGTGTVGGNVINAGVVSPGDAPGTLTINGNYAQMGSGTLLIDIAGADTGQFSVLDVLGTANLKGQLDPVLLNGFIPTVGESFAFLLYGSHTGSLFIHDPNIDDLMEHWMITYQPGEAILTVASGNVSVPDQGSTFLLLTLSLLGLGGTAIKRRTIR